MLILTYLYSITQCGLANYTKKKKKKASLSTREFIRALNLWR